MQIVVSTGYRGHHKDWTIEQEALDDVGVFERDTEELMDYLNEIDERVDSGGRISKQVKTAILDLADGKRERPWNLTLATNSEEDMDVFIKRVEEE